MSGKPEAILVILLHIGSMFLMFLVLMADKITYAFPRNQKNSRSRRYPEEGNYTFSNTQE